MSNENDRAWVEPDCEAPTRDREGYLVEEAEREAINKESAHSSSYVESDAESPTRVREGYMVEEAEKE